MAWADLCTPSFPFFMVHRRVEPPCREKKPEYWEISPFHFFFLHRPRFHTCFPRICMAEKGALIFKFENIRKAKQNKKGVVVLTFRGGERCRAAGGEDGDGGQRPVHLPPPLPRTCRRHRPAFNPPGKRGLKQV